MSDMLRIAICEDNQYDLALLTKILEDSNIRNTFKVYRSLKNLILDYKPYLYDLLIMAINMDDISGIEAATIIRSIDASVVIAFATTSKDYALEAYRLDALKYLEKPVEPNELEALLLLALTKKRYIDAIKVTWEGKPQFIPLANILYMEQNRHKMNVILLQGKTISTYDKVSNYRKKLSKKGFYSGHTSYLVNLSYVRYIDESLNSFVMENDDIIPIRKKSFSEAKQFFENRILKSWVNYK